LSDENEEPSLHQQVKPVKKLRQKQTVKPSTYGLGQKLGTEILKHYSSDEEKKSPDFKMPEPTLSDTEQELVGDFIVTRKLFR